MNSISTPSYLKRMLICTFISLILLGTACDGYGKTHHRRNAHLDMLSFERNEVCETWSDEDVFSTGSFHRVEKRSSYLPPIDCTSPHERGAMNSKASCRPRPRVIRLPWPNSTEVNHMIPSHVIVDRCDGSCHHRKQSCLPRKVIKKSFPVMFAHCTIHDKTCGKICSQVQVDEHLECGCECKIKRHHCNAKQVYRKELCSCQCKDLSEVQACYNSGRVWDPSKCMCRCPLSTLVQCSSKYVFDFTNSCKCIPEETNELEAGRTHRTQP
ncbi:uncharacterized protein [Lepeophtheirus salmonis]|uniref:uncharacterized protein n=1 Tax=Lepeophtheirus salmonis TaxID=72036 RepID=UPI001AE9447E|nr:balbiani ring protein 3-like [Lepeophtheirus salmonis]